MSDTARSSLSRRIVREHRALIVPIAALIALNVVVYLAFVYPLSKRVASVTERTQAAELDLAQARLAHQRAVNALGAKATAGQELETFYRDVLPMDQAAARRLLFPSLVQYARESGVAMRSAGTELTVPSREQTLHEWRVSMELEGSYPGIRSLLQRIERAPEFLVIDGVSLSGGGEEADPLAVQLHVTTFFRGPQP